MSIEIDGLCFAYSERNVLTDVSMKAANGEMVAILGENGAGKSTLFKCILGLLKGYSGKVMVEGKDMARIGPAERARLAAYIPQSSTPVFNYTVGDIVLMGTTGRVGLLSAPGEEQKRAALAAMEEVGITHLKNRDFGMISGGERQLALIARAMAQNAKLLIMDEPTASLDYGNQYRVLSRIHALTKRGYTILMSTHNPEHALWFADKAVVLADRRVLSQGKTKDVITPELIGRVFGVRTAIRTLEEGGKSIPVCVPLGEERKNG